MNLRPYQQEAHDALVSWIKKTTQPVCIEAATGAGKSVVISALAKTINDMSKGKHILCLAPSAELVEQNSEKYKAAGFKASIFSASAGEKSLRHPVVFGTPGTVANSISRFDIRFAAVIIDECHGMTPTVLSIITAMAEANPNLRVIGMSATPYRMGTGYVFGMWPDGSPVSDRETRNPFFAACVYRIRARELIDDGYLTAPVIGQIGSEHYDTIAMQINSMGRFVQADIDKAYEGQGRKTSAVIADIVRQSRDRKGVMIFAATVKHANECMDSLPPELSAIVTGETPKAERRSILKRFKAKKIKYIVNVSVLTTGFDAPHVDVIALLRATESVGLLQQMVGRGLRLDDGKDDCLVLDYAENLERHCPDGDIFSPEVRVRGGDKEEGELRCKCPVCDVENVFSPRPNNEGYEISKTGYFLDLDGNDIQTEWGAMPAHFGRRCQARHIEGRDLVQCDHRWTFRPCPHCDEPNDIAARYCISCKGEIIDPNEKLRIDFKMMKRDPTRMQTDLVKSWSAIPSVSRSGKDMMRIDVVTTYRSFTVWILKESTYPKAKRDRDMFNNLRGEAPRTVTYQKDCDSGFYRIFSYNQKADEEPEK